MSVPDAKALSPAPREDQHLERWIVGGGFADRRQPLIHAERERVSRLRPVENDPADAVADLVKQVCVRGDVFIHFIDIPLRMNPGLAVATFLNAKFAMCNRILSNSLYLDHFCIQNGSAETRGALDNDA